MWKTPTHREKWKSSGRAGGTLPASDPLPRPYSPPFEGTTNTLCGCAIGTDVQTPPHCFAGQAGSILIPVPPQCRFVSFGPRYPSGRIPQCDATPASEVVLTVPAPQLACRRADGGGQLRADPFDAGRSMQVSPIFGGIAPCVQRPALQHHLQAAESDANLAHRYRQGKTFHSRVECE